MPSVAIPAHNEAPVIQRCLRALLCTPAGDGLEICVVANACTDDTARLAREVSPAITVIETPVPTKTNALNLADQTLKSFPRVYVDADCVLSRSALDLLLAALDQPGILAASPLIHVDESRCSWPVRAYYRVWTRLPYARTGISGRVYALSAAGRKRFEQFPAITADDAFVRLHFAPHERQTVAAARSIVTPPTTLAKIIDIKTRSHFGNAQLRHQLPQLWQNEHIRHTPVLLRLALNPLWWPALALYAYVKLATRWRVRRRFQRGQIHQWERDDSSRQPAEKRAQP